MTTLPASPRPDARIGSAALRPDTLAAARRREIALLTRYATSQDHGLLAPARVEVSGGSSVHVDGVDGAGTLFVEAHAYDESLDRAQSTLVVQDLFKLALVGRTHPSARTVLVLAGLPAARSVRALVAVMPSLREIEIVVVAPE